MQAVYLDRGKVETRRRRRPRPAKGHALIRLLCGGICNTDLELKSGYYGFEGVPGHEFVGEVVEAESVEWIGRRVVGEINLDCGRCPWCRRGLSRHCPKRKVLGIVRHPGAFQEFFTLPERNLHAVPDSLEDESAVFTEPVAAACEILEQVTIPHGAPVAVMGDGKLGLLIAQVLRAGGADVRLFGRHDEKCAIAAAMGIPAEVTGAKGPRRAFDWVVEATGSRKGLRQAIAAARPRGTIVMKSTVHGDVRINTAPVIVDEITLVGSRCGPFEPALRLLAERMVQTAPLVSESWALTQAPQAFRRAAARGVLKVLLYPAGGANR